MSGTATSCPHVYERFRPWPIKNRYRCARCGLVTRLYDSVDRMAGRPIHRWMSVAMRGVNVG